MYLIHAEKAAVDSWFKLLAIIPLGLIIGGIASFYTRDAEAGWVLLGEAALFILIFYFVLPRSYQIYPDRLRIVLGNPLAINIPFSTIREAAYTRGSAAVGYFGVRLATSTHNVIEIRRKRGLGYVISPQNGDIFLEQLNQARRAAGLS